MTNVKVGVAIQTLHVQCEGRSCHTNTSLVSNISQSNCSSIRDFKGEVLMLQMRGVDMPDLTHWCYVGEYAGIYKPAKQIHFCILKLDTLSLITTLDDTHMKTE